MTACFILRFFALRIGQCGCELAAVSASVVSMLLFITMCEELACCTSTSGGGCCD
jgi:hypothetical protein